MTTPAFRLSPHHCLRPPPCLRAHPAGRCAHQIAARWARSCRRASPVGAECSEPSCDRRHDHVRRAVSRPSRCGRAGGRVARVSVCDAHSTCGERRRGRRRFVRNCPRPWRGSTRSRRCSGLSHVRLGACARGVVLNRHAAWGAVRVSLDGRATARCCRPRFLFECGVRRRRVDLHAQSARRRCARYRQYGVARHGHRQQRACPRSDLALADFRSRTAARPWPGRRRLGLGDGVWQSAVSC